MMSQQIVVGLDKVQVGYVAAGSKLSALGVTLLEGLRKLTLTNLGSSSIYIKYNGTVGTGSFELSTNYRTVSLYITKQEAAKLTFTCAEGSSANMDVQQQGPQTY